MSLIHPPFGAKGKDKAWNKELRGRFYGQFSNKFGDQLLVEVSQILALDWTTVTQRLSDPEPSLQ